MKPKQIMILLFIFILILFSVRCDTTEPPNKATLTLELEDVSCTEAWIMLKLKDIPLPSLVTLYKNNNAQNNILCYGDTLLYVDSLLPKQIYTYQASCILKPTSNNAVAISNALSVTTMDTTSHAFTWQTWTFGEHSSSVLYDVAIINENNIWAVGEIYMKDSLGRPDPTFYNAVHWNGTDWELKKIFYKNGIWSIRTVFAFNENDIWFSGYMRYYNGQFIELSIPSILMGWQINKLWGSSNNDLYAVGNGGNIAHWDGVKWSKIESGTTSIINDIWGIVTENNETLAYCPVSSFWTPGDKKLLSIKGNSVDSIPWTFNRLVYSVWTPNERVIYVCGGGIFERKNNQWKEINITSVAVNRVRGNYLNDILVAGDFGFVAHFNGATWNIEEYDFNSGYGGLSIKENATAVVGQRNGKALIKIGKRN